MNRSQQRGHEWLATQGFNLQAVMRADQWPQRLRQSMEECQVSLESTRRFVMLGAGGRLLWQQSGGDLTDRDHPLDTFSVNAADRVVTEYWGGGEVEILYPGSLPVPLQQLGVFAGWSHVSPLGIGINTGFGTWFAYRALFALDGPLQETVPLASQGAPCDRCVEKPCQSACPAGAVRLEKSFDLDRCVSHRLKSASSCADRCLARLACPVGQDWRYDEDQLVYHGQRSLASLRAWREEQSDSN